MSRRPSLRYGAPLGLWFANVIQPGRDVGHSASSVESALPSRELIPTGLTYTAQQNTS
jgi:hypothetical protein